MATTIRDAFVLPAHEDLQAMGFVVRLRDEDAATEGTRRLVNDYVLTPAVQAELPRILKTMSQVHARGEEYGRFVHGSFGSGKSHFLSMLGLLLEDSDLAWQKDDATIGAMAGEHRAWIRDANLLVVRLHMLTLRGRETGLDRAVYDAFNHALERHGKPGFEFLHVEGILEEARQEAQTYGAAFWVGLENAGVVGSRTEFEELAAGTPEERESLARAYLGFKKRDAASAGIDPRWSDGLRRMTEHAKAQGFGGVVLLIDEFLLWLAEKSGTEFKQEINNLLLIVDHSTGKRALPVFAFVAVQRNLKEFFPDLTSEDEIHAHLAHNAQRFDRTQLEDVELRHIVKGRVLRPRDPAALAQAIEGLIAAQQKVLPALGDVEYLKDVYPFHPSLIEMLVDVTSLMQRERSALRLLYELLVYFHADLPVGQFIPVGSAFDALFPQAGVEADRKGDTLRDVHHQYYQRLSLAIRQMADEAKGTGDVFPDNRRQVLEQLVKTVLLAEVSPRLRGASGLTIERLVQLNWAEVEGDSYRGRILQAETDLRALSRRVADLQVTGTGKTALVRYVLGRVSLTEILARSKEKVNSTAWRFKTVYSVLKPMLGVAKRKGFGEGEPLDGDYDVIWRGTRRRGSLKIANIRDLTYADFHSGEGFRILVDYPWDDPGHSVEEDRIRAGNARKQSGNQFTVCWLPRHMTPEELSIVLELSAVRYLLTPEGQEDLLTNLGQQDKQKVLEQARARETALQHDLEKALVTLYKEHGEFFALTGEIDPARPFPELDKNLQHIARLLLDRKYPAHPNFPSEPTKRDLELVLEWLEDAANTAMSVGFDADKEAALRAVAMPLELVTMGQTKATLRTDTRYVKEVLQRADQDQVSWDLIAEHLKTTFGLQSSVVDLFLCFLCQRGYRALEAGTGEVQVPRIGMPAVPLRLQRGQLLGAPEWSRLRELVPALFGAMASQPPAQRSLQAQDRAAKDLRTAGENRRHELQGLHANLVELGVQDGERLKELHDANLRLAALARSTTDSFAVLKEFVDAWPNETTDPLRHVVSKAAGLVAALEKLDRNSRQLLLNARGHAKHGPEVAGLLDSLLEMLSASEAAGRLSSTAITDWNRKAHALTLKIVGSPEGGDKGDGDKDGKGDTDGKDVPGAKVPKAVLERRVDLSNADEVGAFLGELRQKLKEVGRKPGQVRVTWTED